LILVDSNIVIDIATNDPHRASWSLAHLERAVGSDVVAINDVIYAELAAGYGHTGALDRDLELLRIFQCERLPKPALFLAGHAFRRYRQRRGMKTGVLSDFFIGAHAVVTQSALLTRDPTRVRTYFPTVQLIAP